MESSESSLLDKTLTASIENLNGREASGLNLYNLKLDGKVDDQAIAINSMAINLNRNTLRGNVKLGYPSINELINNPTDINSIISLDSGY